MGTLTYGYDTGAGFSTFEEMRFILTRKPYFLIKMCSDFQDAETQLRLSISIMYIPWTPGEPLPAGLVDHIVDKLNSLSLPVASPSMSATSLPASATTAGGGGPLLQLLLLHQVKQQQSLLLVSRWSSYL